MNILLKHPATIFILAIITLSYLWIYFFYNHDFIRELGEFTLSIIGYIVSLVWILKTFFVLKKEKEQGYFFWLFLGLGTVPYILAWINSAYYYLLLRTSAPYPGFADFLWLFAYSIWIFALIYELIKVANKDEIIRYLFDICIFMIVVSALIWELLLSEILFNLSGNFITDFVGVAYPVINLVLLFVSILLFYTTRNSNKRTIFTIISFGFFFQTFADFIYVHQSLEGTYKFAGWIDPLWTLTLLLKGASGLFRLHEKKSILNVESTKIEVKSSDMISFVLLSIFVCYIFYRYYENFSFLEYAFFTLIVMVFTKYIIVLFQNRQALDRLDILSKSLEMQVENKTQELQTALSRVKKMALYDNLTGLPNRYMLNQHLFEAIERCKQKKKKLAILFLDLDRFKFVNDTMGHDTGDMLLKDVSIRISRCVRAEDLIARLGGDEFIVLIEDTSKEHVTEVAQCIINEFVAPFILKGREFYTTTSVGISLFPNDGENQEELLTSADKAMYLAKERGKNNFQFYCIVHDTVNRKLDLERGLRRAIEKNELYLHYQPQIDLETNQIVGMEALLRWKHSELGKIAPDEFIPVAEETGLIIPIGKWVLRTACSQIKTFLEEGFSPLKVAVNVSPYQFKDPSFLEDAKKIIQETGIPPELLEIEITESLMQDIKESSVIINELKKTNVNISIDDFGTGYSSLSVLSSLKIDRIKIDRYFIKDMITSLNTETMVKTIIDMAKNLNTEVLAEGIENEEQAKILKGLKCNFGQGYFYYPPLAIKEMEKVLKRNFLND